MEKTRVFLADDHSIVLEGLKTLINAQPDMEVVGEANDGRAAVQKAPLASPDVVVMDISMPGLNGAQATEELKKEIPNARFLALTMHEDRGYLHRFLEAGATGYVLKRAASVELVQAIREVASGGLYLDPTLGGQVVTDLVRRKPLSGSQRKETLSAREIEVVRLVAMGFDNREIAAELEISVKTVEAHKAHAMEKLGVKNRTGLVRYALQRGWLQDS